MFIIVTISINRRLLAVQRQRLTHLVNSDQSRPSSSVTIIIIIITAMIASRIIILSWYYVLGPQVWGRCWRAYREPLIDQLRCKLSRFFLFSSSSTTSGAESWLANYFINSFCLPSPFYWWCCILRDMNGIQIQRCVMIFSLSLLTRASFLNISRAWGWNLLTFGVKRMLQNINHRNPLSRRHI